MIVIIFFLVGFFSSVWSKNCAKYDSLVCITKFGCGVSGGNALGSCIECKEMNSSMCPVDTPATLNWASCRFNGDKCKAATCSSLGKFMRDYTIYGDPMYDSVNKIMCKGFGCTYNSATHLCGIATGAIVAIVLVIVFVVIIVIVVVIVVVVVMQKKKKKETGVNPTNGSQVPQQTPGQYPPQQPGQFQYPPGQYPPQQPGQFPPQQPGQYQYPPGQYPPQQPGQYQYPAGQYPPQQPGQFPPQQPGQYQYPPGQFPPGQNQQPGQFPPPQGQLPPQGSASDLPK